MRYHNFSALRGGVWLLSTKLTKAKSMIISRRAHGQARGPALRSALHLAFQQVPGLLRLLTGNEVEFASNVHSSDAVQRAFKPRCSTVPRHAMAEAYKGDLGFYASKIQMTRIQRAFKPRIVVIHLTVHE